MRIRYWLCEPLLHFFALGAGLFLLFGWLDRDGGEAPDEIVVDVERVAVLRGQFERLWHRPPTADEMVELIDRWVREEIFYREGLALGLDQDDAVLRQRIVQKIRFISDTLVDDTFTEAELETYLAENADGYRIDPQYTFRQIYFDPQHDDDFVASVRETIDRSDPGIIGDPTLLPEMMSNAALSDVAGTFGSEFVAALAELPTREWAGPVHSGYGSHLVHIEKRIPARLPGLDEVRRAVERDLLAERTEQAAEAFYQSLRERYNVRVAEKVSLAWAAGPAQGNK